MLNQAEVEYWEQLVPDKEKYAGDKSNDLVGLIEKAYPTNAFVILEKWANTFFSLLNEYTPQEALVFIQGQELNPDFR